jgi:acetolactate synthase-1/2/3 large subunit
MSSTSELAAELSARGVERVFGVPGTQTVPFIDALRAEGIDFVLAAHEGGAAFMAIGAARASGSFSVLCTIGGPGFTNALTGLVEARHDSVPVLHIVNAPAQDDDRSFLLQAIDHEALSRDAVHAVVRLGPSGSAKASLAEAISRMTSGEPGPVLLELGRQTPEPVTPVHDPEIASDNNEATSWDRLAELWREARRPLFYVGYGAAEASDSVRAIAERHRVPVMTTPSARGILPEGHALALTFDPPKGGLSLANDVLAESDLVIAAGCKLTHNGSSGFGLRLDQGTLVHIDRSPAVLGANYRTELTLRSSARRLFSFLGAQGARTETAEWDPTRLATASNSLRQASQSDLEPRVAGRPAADFFAWLREAMPPSAVLITDSGQHQVMARRHYQVQQVGGLLFPSDFQSMGFAIPAAIGHRLADPSRLAVALLGDGGFLMSGMELTGASRAGVGLPVIVFNDGYLGQIRMQQIKESGHATGVKTGHFVLEALASGMGCGYTAFDWDTPPDLTRMTDSSRSPTLIEVPVTDPSGLAYEAAKQRLKGVARRSLGESTVDGLKDLLRRGRSS